MQPSLLLRIVMVSAKTFSAYLSIYELANYSSAKTFVSQHFCIDPYSSKGSEIANSTCIFLDWFLQPLKGHSHLCDRADLDTSFVNFEKRPPQPAI